MAMNGNDRAQAIYNAVAANNPNFSKLSPAEKNQLLTNLQVIYGADTTYIQTNAEADPGTLATTATTIIAPPSGGPCSGPGTITGKGTIA